VTVDGTPFYPSMSNLVTIPINPPHERLKRRHTKGKISYGIRLARRKGKRLEIAIGLAPKRQVEHCREAVKETLKLTLKRAEEDRLFGERAVRNRLGRLAARFVLQGLAAKAISRKMAKRGHREAKRTSTPVVSRQSLRRRALLEAEVHADWCQGERTFGRHVVCYELGHVTSIEYDLRWRVSEAIRRKKSKASTSELMRRFPHGHSLCKRLFDPGYDWEDELSIGEDGTVYCTDSACRLEKTQEVEAERKKKEVADRVRAAMEARKLRRKAVR